MSFLGANGGGFGGMGSSYYGGGGMGHGSMMNSYGGGMGGPMMQQ